MSVYGIMLALYSVDYFILFVTLDVKKNVLGFSFVELMHFPCDDPH